MQVVIGIDREAFAGVGLQIRVPRFEVGAHRIAPAADFVPGVRRHVVDVAGAGNGLAEILARTLPPGRAAPWTRWRARRDGRRRDASDRSLQRRFEHAVQPLDVRRVDVARAAARLEQEQRVGVERDGVEVVGILRRRPCAIASA